MFIQTFQLEDPGSMEFVPGIAILPPGEGPRDETAAAASSPLARRLLRITDVEGVSLKADSLTVRRAHSAEWYVLKPPVLGAIMEHFDSGDPVLAESPVLDILGLLDDRVRPAIAAYGGEVRFHGLDPAGVLSLELIGGGGATKKSMIGNIMTHHLPEVSEVVWIGEVEDPGIPPSVLEPGPDGPQGPEAEAIIQLLDEKVNPAVAAHGGYITLIDVVDHVAYMRMDGGCQGCAASSATLQQGVRNLLMTEIPGIQGVIDVTDHTAGDNPFYQ